MPVRDVIIIGAGPSGLSAAIAAKARGLDYQVLEQGVLVNSIYRFPPQMVFFTTPELLEIGGLPFVSPHDKPTRVEALKYYRKVVEKFDLQIAFDERVLSVEREDPELDEERLRPSRAEDMGIRGEGSASGRAGGGAPAPLQESQPTLFTVATQSSRGVRRVRQARAVVFAVGYYDHPVRLNVPGEDLPHVRHYYTEPYAFYRQRVVLVGGGNSAAEAALELYRAGAHVTLVHRRPALRPTIKYWVRPDIENRIKEGSIAARFGMRVREIRSTSVIIGEEPQAEPRQAGREGHVGQAGEQRTLATGEAPLETDAHARVAYEYEIRRGPEASGAGSDRAEEIPCDAVFLLTGYRADSTLFTNAGITLTPREGPVHDPQTFETNVPGLYVAGGALAGVDTGTIFIENGRFHGEKLIDAIAARL